MEPLTDPLNDRIIKSCPAPPHKPLTSEQIFTTSATAPDWKSMIVNFHKGGRLSKEAVYKILKLATDVFKKEDNIVKVSDPVIFVGDIHG